MGDELERIRDAVTLAPERRRDAWAIAGLVAVALALNPFLILPGKTFLPADVLRNMFPWATGSGSGSPHTLWMESLRLEYVFMDFWKKSLAGGQFPLWNPLLGGGVPFAAVGSTALFAPLNFLFLLLPTADAFNVLRFLQFLLAGTFMYAFLKSLRLSAASAFLGAVVSVSNLWFILQDMTIVMRGPLVWTPLVLLLTRRFVLDQSRWAWLGLAAAVLVQLLSGSTESALYGTILTFAYGLFLIHRETRRRHGFHAARAQYVLLAAAYGLGFLMAAPQTLPLVEAARLGSRGVVKPGAAAHSAPLWHLATLLSPNFFGPPSQDDFYTYWGPLYGLQALLRKVGYEVSYWDNYYIGVVALALALVAVLNVRHPSLRFFRAAAVAVLLWTMLGPLYGLLVFGLPVFNQISTPDRAIGVLTPCAAILVAFGFERLRNPDASLRSHAARIGRGMLATAAALAGGLLLVPLLLAALNRTVPSWPEKAVEKGRATALAVYGTMPDAAAKFERRKAEIAEFLRRGARRTGNHFSPANPDFAIALLLLAATGLLFLRRERIARFPVVIAGLLVADGLLLSWRTIPWFDKKDLFPETAGIRFLERNVSHYRAAALSRRPTSFEDNRRNYFSNVLEPNFLMAYGLADIRFHGSLTPRRLHQYGAHIAGGDPEGDWHRLILWEDGVSKRLLDLASVRYLISQPGDSAPAGYTKAYEGPDLSIFETAQATPRAWLAGSYRLGRTPEDRFQMLVDPAFDPSREVVLEEPVGRELERGEDSVGSVEIVEYTPNRVRLLAQLKRPAILVLADTYYPGWTAAVDGRPAPILPANHFMRALVLAQGTHQVEYRFWPPTLSLGLWLSTAGLVLTLLGTFLLPKPRPPDFGGLEQLPERSDLVLLDLDQSLVHGDSFFAFLWFCLRSTRRLFWRRVLAPFRGANAGDRRLQAKAALLNLVAPSDTNALQRLVADYVAGVLAARVRPELIEWVRKVQGEGARVYLVSASPDLWVEPLAARLGLDGAICSQLIHDPARGFLPATRNCMGREKVRRVRQVLDLARFERITGIGNSRHDEPLLRLCTERILV